MLYIHNATILTPKQRISDGAVLADEAQITAVGPSDEITSPDDAQVIDGQGLILAPGFIDLQINGACGYDFTDDPSSIWPVGTHLPRYGVTAFLPTIITSPLEKISAAQRVVSKSTTAKYRGAIPLGLHIEGPFLNPKKKGAHNPDYLRSPDLSAIQDWSPTSGVRLVTLAPELPGALDLVAELSEKNVAVSAGHSTATYEEALAGFDAGIRYGTHLFNAMPSLHHRQPGLTVALLTDPRPSAGMIVDGIHAHPAVVDLAWQLLGNTRLTLVTDAMAALGMPPGKHILGDFDVIVDQTSARLADGTLAGSVLSLDTALQNLIAFTGCSLEEALPTVTTTPARLLGLANSRGQIAPGYTADLVLLTPELNVHTTIVKGKPVYTQ
jgi:N-acetylglucosamine-6-phosphate deacetylase